VKPQTGTATSPSKTLTKEFKIYDTGTITLEVCISTGMTGHNY
jgi:hypothetical protein